MQAPLALQPLALLMCSQRTREQFVTLLETPQLPSEKALVWVWLLELQVTTKCIRQQPSV